jgi:hypothetical protein
MELSIEDRTLLERLEESLWEEETRFDAHFISKVIAPDFFEFGRSGRVYQRDDTLAIRRQPIVAVLPLPGFRARLLDENTAQVTYNSVVTYNGTVEHARRSSIWSRAESGWVLRFHQGTPFHA